MTARFAIVTLIRLQMQADASPCRTRPVLFDTSRRIRPVPGNSTCDARESSDASCMPVPRKRTKKRDGRGGKETRVSIRQKESKRALNAKQKSPSKYHVWNGQIVAVEMVSEPSPSPAHDPPQAPDISASQPTVSAEETSEELESLAQPRHRSRRENQAMIAPLSSPPGCSTSRSLRPARSSPRKGNLWDSFYQSGGTWPELPAAFSQWDIQVRLSPVTTRVRWLSPFLLL